MPAAEKTDFCSSGRRLPRTHDAAAECDPGSIQTTILALQGYGSRLEASLRPGKRQTSQITLAINLYHHRCKCFIFSSSKLPHGEVRAQRASNHEGALLGERH